MEAPRRSPLVTRLLAVVLSLTLAISVLGLSLIPALLPSTTSALAARHARVEESGLTPEQMAGVVSDLHSFSVLGSIDELPREVAGIKAFDESMVDHLVDVRSLIHRAVIATAVFVAASVALTIALRRDRRSFRRAIVVGGALPLAAVGALALWAATDFGSFFSWFHSMFFAAGTWTFSSSSLLIQAVPEPFWVAMGGVWATSLTGLSIAVIAAGVLGWGGITAGSERGF